MLKRKVWYWLIGLGIVGAIVIGLIRANSWKDLGSLKSIQNNLTNFHPLSIEALRQGNYPGSKIVIEETLESGSNYDRYLTSYQSEGLKIYAYLSVPQGELPKNGWPVIVFNHGYIPPEEYRSTERYIAYTDGFSRNGYIVFRPDYRGHGISEGEPEGAYGSNSYTIDVLNAVSSIKKYPTANPKQIGMWGHSMGGHISLRAMVTTKDVKAGVIWAGVVASYPDLFYNWHRPNRPRPSFPPGRISWRQTLVGEYGEPTEESEFWKALSATSYLSDLSGAIQLHHGTADDTVPHAFSKKLDRLMKAKKQTSELYIYEGDDHNLAQNFNLAMERSLSFFDKYLK